MQNALNKTVPKEDMEEIKEFVSTILPLSKEDRAVLLMSANTLRIRKEIADGVREEARGTPCPKGAIGTKGDTKSGKGFMEKYYF